MKLRDTLDSIVPDPAAGQVYGQPYETPDGATVLPVAKVRGRTRPGARMQIFVSPPGRSAYSSSRTATRPGCLRSIRPGSL